MTSLFSVSSSVTWDLVRIHVDVGHLVILSIDTNCRLSPLLDRALNSKAGSWCLYPRADPLNVYCVNEGRSESINEQPLGLRIQRRDLSAMLSEAFVINFLK